jgi:hypothetical protein
VDPARGVDLFDRQLGGVLHGDANRVTEGTGQADPNGISRRAASAKQEGDSNNRTKVHVPTPKLDGSGGPPQTSAVRDWTDRSAEAVFDLHGQTITEAAVNAERFLRAQARARPGCVVRLITGRGRGGTGAPIRARIRGLLRALKASGTIVLDYVLEDTEGSYLVRLRT